MPVLFHRFHLGRDLRKEAGEHNRRGEAAKASKVILRGASKRHQSRSWPCRDNGASIIAERRWAIVPDTQDDVDGLNFFHLRRGKIGRPTVGSAQGDPAPVRSGLAIYEPLSGQRIAVGVAGACGIKFHHGACLCVPVQNVRPDPVVHDWDGMVAGLPKVIRHAPIHASVEFADWSGQPDHQDERRAHAPGVQGGARGGSGDRGDRGGAGNDGGSRGCLDGTGDGGLAQVSLLTAGNEGEVRELVADKGYHDNGLLAWCERLEIRTYIPERKQKN